MEDNIRNDSKYFNLFECDETIQNNVARGLAILLRSEPLLLDRFVDMTNEKLHMGRHMDRIPKPTAPSQREVSFSQRPSRLADSENCPLRIVGLTLTPFKTSAAPAEELPEDLVTDVAVHFGDDLVLIEVKTGESDAGEQVTQQARRLRKALERRGEPRLPEVVSPLEITWEEMIDVMGDVYRLQGEDRHSILGQYLHYLASHYPSWYPTPFVATDDRFSTQHNAWALFSTDGTVSPIPTTL